MIGDLILNEIRGGELHTDLLVVVDLKGESIAQGVEDEVEDSHRTEWGTGLERDKGMSQVMNGEGDCALVRVEVSAGVDAGFECARDGEPVLVVEGLSTEFEEGVSRFTEVDAGRDEDYDLFAVSRTDHSAAMDSQRHGQVRHRRT